MILRDVGREAKTRGMTTTIKEVKVMAGVALALVVLVSLFALGITAVVGFLLLFDKLFPERKKG